MTDQELRALVRAAIAKQMGEPAPATPQPRMPSLHASHGVYEIARDLDEGAAAPDGDVPCIIEPSVPCTHCNYCKSHGH